MILTIVGVLGIFLFVSLYFKSTSKNAAPPPGDFTTVAPEIITKNESSLPIAIVLYDRVNFEAVEDSKKNLVLNTGDFLRVVEASTEKTGVFKVQNKMGHQGWVVGNQFIRIPDVLEMNEFYSSTVPLSTLFNDQSEADEETRLKYTVLTGNDFLARAKNNQDPIVATWANDLEIANKPGATPDPGDETEN